jgi:hypothetical protein
MESSTDSLLRALLRESGFRQAKNRSEALTRNLDSGPSLPIPDEGYPVKLWWWIAIVVVVALAILFVLWGRD